MRGCLEEVRPRRLAETGAWVCSSYDDYMQHHDMVKLPNGNILTIVWERISTDQAIELGQRIPEFVAENGNFWFDGIVES